jgi:ketosteroid isomerase-like protein
MDEDAKEVIALERAALDRWGKGDPDGFLEITAPDAVYFDPFHFHSLNRGELAAMYGECRGKIHIVRDEIVKPQVQLAADIAILTFAFVSYGTEGSMRWHATEVYRRLNEQWRIVHTHWSLIDPDAV